MDPCPPKITTAFLIKARNVEQVGLSIKRNRDAEMVLYDSFAMTIDEQIVANELRYVTVGKDAVGRILAVIYSYRSDTIRLILARKATRKERTQYEEGI